MISEVSQFPNSLEPGIPLGSVQLGAEELLSEVRVEKRCLFFDGSDVLVL